MKKNIKNKIVIYQAKNGAIELRGDSARETIWATQKQISEIFSIDRTVATKHIGNVLNNKEVEEKSNVQKMHIPNSDKPIAFYSLDIILAVGYRANSARAIQFRQWATKTLKSYIVDGYAINKARIAKNYEQFLEAVENVKALLPAGGAIDAASALELIKAFADTWVSLDAYDKDLPAVSGVKKKEVRITAEQLVAALANFKSELLQKKEATNIFGQERQPESVAGIVGNVMQSFGGKPLYPTVEEKAAHLLYFLVKNHPFVDGNKRNGAYAFVWFLKKAGILDVAKLTPTALTALTLFVAESDPKQKEKMVRVVLRLLKK